MAPLRLGAAFFLAAFGFAAVSLATSLAGTATATPLAFAFGAFLARAGFLPGPFAAGLTVVFGVLTTDNVQQAMDRAASKDANKGYEALLVAVEMVNVLRQVS